MFVSSQESSDPVPGDLGAQCGQALVHGRQFDLLVRLDCFFAGPLEAPVGQQQMGQAAQVQVSQDRVPVQHLVIAQPQVLVQLFEQEGNKGDANG